LERWAPHGKKGKRVSPVSKRQGQQMRPVHKAHHAGCLDADSQPKGRKYRSFGTGFAGLKPILQVISGFFWRFPGGGNQKIAMRQVRRRATDSSVCTLGRPVRPAKRFRKNLDTSDTYEALPRKFCPAEAFGCFPWIYSRLTP
jgi:hypothetical protein